MTTKARISIEAAGHDEMSPTAALIQLFDDHRLTPVQRRIAKSLVTQGMAAPLLSSNELASQAGVSQPSVTRFAVAVGYRGYPELRRKMRTVLSELTVKSNNDAQRNELQDALDAEIENIRQLSDLVRDRRQLRAVAKVLSSSRPLPIVGFRASASLAQYFSFFAAKILPDVRNVSGGSSVFDELQQMRSAGATALLAFAVPRYPRELMSALSFAKTLGYQIVVITDSVLSPVQEEADIVLAAPVGTQLVFDSLCAPLLLATMVLEEIGNTNSRRTLTRLDAFEEMAGARYLFSE